MKKLGILGIVGSLLFLIAIPSLFASPLTQGEYAIQLAEKLGLGKNLSVEAAISALTGKGIMPVGGFKPEQPMNPAVAEEILQSARKACAKGLLAPLSCKEVDTIIASLNEQLGLLIPEAPTPPPLPPRHPASPAY